jgi:hypothetical protein
VGQQPETVDFTDPALPPATTAEKIHVGTGRKRDRCRSKAPSAGSSMAVLDEAHWQHDMSPPAEPTAVMHCSNLSFLS